MSSSSVQLSSLAQALDHTFGGGCGAYPKIHGCMRMPNGLGIVTRGFQGTVKDKENMNG